VAGRTVYSSAEGRNVPANRRRLGIVFQSFAIWPHMTVLQNVTYPLRLSREMRRRYPRAGAEEAARAMLGVVELEQYAERPATQLSGGQQQRLALARALVARPRVLLLDKPLSSLDAKLRQRIGVELKRLQRDLGITTIFVTHDQTEALELSDRIAVMREGRVEQVGTPREVYEQPGSAFVADFVGTSNQLRGTVSDAVGDAVRVDLGEGATLVAAYHSGTMRPGDPVVATGRPEAMSFAAGPSDPADNS
jgi:iron(III) transport system ATP-binding protein